tara:strand:+ start:174 stop:365 length:192 start_codon:yes stop_codon:yes gene_type:complete
MSKPQTIFIQVYLTAAQIDIANKLGISVGDFAEQILFFKLKERDKKRRAANRKKAKKTVKAKK